MSSRAFWGSVWLGAVFFLAPACAQAEITEVAPGIYRGDPVTTAADYQYLRQHGIRTVIDVRYIRKLAMARERWRLSAMGIAYYQVPIRFPLRDNSPDQALALLADPRLRPALIHCNLGNDREGLVIALYRVRYQGWSKAAAFAEMNRFGLHHFLPGLAQYLWNYPVPSRPPNPPPSRIEQQGTPIIAARPSQPSPNSQRGFFGRRWR